MVKIYIAGKIRNERKRGGIVEYGCNDLEEYINQKSVQIDNKFQYVGPFTIGCDHSCYHGKSSHGAGADGRSCCSPIDEELGLIVKNIVFTKSLEQIKSCDVLLAYIDSNDCYGTITEITYAASLFKKVFITFDKKTTNYIEDFWFVNKFGTLLPYNITTIKDSLDWIRTKV